MVKIIFIAADGGERSVDAPVGNSVMEAALDNGVPGIDADCGGNCACATCHVFVAPEWLAATGSKSDMEESMLDFAEGTTPESRLACQIIVSDALDGMIVRTPVSQH